MGKMQRQKGQRGEREVRDLLREYGFWAERGRSQSAGGGAEDPDVRSNLDGLHIEVKFQQAVPKYLYKCMDQAVEDAKELSPVVFMRRNNEDWLVVMSAEDFLRRERLRIGAL